MDLLDALDNAHRLARDRMAEIKPEQWDLPTPCEDWDAGRVALHLAQTMDAYDALLMDKWAVPEVQERIQALTNTPETGVSMVEEASQRLRARFREPGILARPIPYPGLEPFDGGNLARFSVFECCVHSWDIAQALGVDGTFSEDLAQIGYDGALPYLETVREVGFLKPPITDEPNGDSAQARLLHLFGRPV